MNPRLPGLIEDAVEKFQLSLTGTRILTEAATGHFAVTPVIAARAGAEVFAFTRASRFGSVADVERETAELSAAVSPDLPIHVVTSLDSVPLDTIDVATNTGFLRPFDARLIDRLPRSCVIPLMWETWEWRPDELDLDACRRAGIKVYGTDEDDERLRTKEYLGFVVLQRLLAAKRTPLSSRVLVLGSTDFTAPVHRLLCRTGYTCTLATVDDRLDAAAFDVLVLLEHRRRIKLVGDAGALIPTATLRAHHAVIHICGEADFSGLACYHDPALPARFGAMSYTADHVDPKAVVDLHAAGLNVAAGMLKANAGGLAGGAYRQFMETACPGQAFADERYW